LPKLRGGVFRAARRATCEEEVPLELAGAARGGFEECLPWMSISANYTRNFLAPVPLSSNDKDNGEYGGAADNIIARKPPVPGAQAPR